MYYLTPYKYYIDYKKLVKYLWIKYSSSLYDSQVMKDCKMINYCINHKKDYIDYKTGKILLTYDKAINIYLSGIYYNDKDYKRCNQLLKADNSRYNRLIKRIIKFINYGDCVFFTLTFNDNTLNNTSDKTRRKYVSKFLKSISYNYIANIDFGDENNREHYHGICLLNEPDKINLWKYGFSNVQTINNDLNDVGKLSHYIIKLGKHFQKESVKRNYVIYSINR